MTTEISKSCETCEHFIIEETNEINCDYNKKCCNFSGWVKKEINKEEKSLCPICVFSFDGFKAPLAICKDQTLSIQGCKHYHRFEQSEKKQFQAEKCKKCDYWRNDEGCKYIIKDGCWEEHKNKKIISNQPQNSIYNSEEIQFQTSDDLNEKSLCDTCIEICKNPFKEAVTICVNYNKDINCDLDNVPFPPEVHISTQQKIELLFNNFKEFLKEKNRRYGDSALNPIQIFSKQDAGSQIDNRLDDKLSRIKESKELRKNDLCYLWGYIALKLIEKDWTDFNDLLD